MKKFVAFVALGLTLAVSAPAYAFVLVPNGGRELATDHNLVVRDYRGTTVYDVSFNPQTSEQKAVLRDWIESRSYVLLGRLGAISSLFKSNPEQYRIDALQAQVSSLTAAIGNRQGTGFNPYTDGKRTITGENADGKFLVRNGAVLKVPSVSSPEYVDWLLTQRWDLEGQLNAIPKVDNTEADETLANSGIVGEVKSLVATASVLFGR